MNNHNHLSSDLLMERILEQQSRSINYLCLGFVLLIVVLATNSKVRQACARGIEKLKVKVRENMTIKLKENMTIKLKEDLDIKLKETMDTSNMTCAVSGFGPNAVRVCTENFAPVQGCYNSPNQLNHAVLTGNLELPNYTDDVVGVNNYIDRELTTSDNTRVNLPDADGAEEESLAEQMSNVGVMTAFWSPEMKTEMALAEITTNQKNTTFRPTDIAVSN